ncbi:hypothetical protein [Actinomadura madurae]|uniref:hypothetical protein n=1 Tax=Actinomadura madurae TaxID=1993 RepID=UPI0020D1FD9E|nr:hypothetical protein [Actinomadura madurae]MCQ0017051.1 hypothetical protein [Actinomadura madurae]
MPVSKSYPSTSQNRPERGVPQCGQSAGSGFDDADGRDGADGSGGFGTGSGSANSARWAPSIRSPHTSQ